MSEDDTVEDLCIKMMGIMVDYLICVFGIKGTEPQTVSCIVVHDSAVEHGKVPEFRTDHAVVAGVVGKEHVIERDTEIGNIRIDLAIGGILSEIIGVPGKVEHTFRVSGSSIVDGGDVVQFIVNRTCAAVCSVGMDHNAGIVFKENIVPDEFTAVNCDTAVLIVAECCIFHCNKNF